MDIYNKEEARKIINRVLDIPYEGLYSYEIEKELGTLFKKAEENNDEEIKQEILWEIGLLNRFFGHKGTYQGNEVEEICNKWGYFLDTEEFKLFSNLPFCEWKKEAIDYYKERYSQTESSLAKARYAFAIMVFSVGGERLDWMKKSADGWLKTAEKYIIEKVYSKKYYEIPPLAYEFALKLSLLFSQKELAGDVLDSLHKSIFKIINEGDERWNLELFRVESKYINQFQDISKLKEESYDKLREIIADLKGKKAHHFIRSYMSCLIAYIPESEKYDLEGEVANTFIKEAEEREEPLIKCHLLENAIKEYQKLKSKYLDKKKDIIKKIEDLKLKISEESKKIVYKEFKHEIEIKDGDIKKRIGYYKSNGDLFSSFIKSNEFIPNKKEIKNQVKALKKSNPLGFMITHTTNSRFGPIAKYSSEEEIFELKYRQHYSIGVRISSFFLNSIWQKIEEELGSLFCTRILELLEQKELSEIKEFLIKSINHFEKKDYLSSIHLLIPYLEEIIRIIIRKSGETDNVLKTERNKFFRKIEFGSLVSNENVKSILDENLLETINIFLLSDDQFNLRNLLCHGIVSRGECNRYNNVYLIYLTLKLTSLLKNIENKASGEKNGTR